VRLLNQDGDEDTQDYCENIVEENCLSNMSKGIIEGIVSD
jgi:hypothetical protein